MALYQNALIVSSLLVFGLYLHSLMLPPVLHSKPLPLNPKCQWRWKRILWLKWGLLYCCFNCLGQCFSRLQQWPQPADSSRQMLLYQKKYLKNLTQHPNTNSSTCTFSHSGVVFVGLYIYISFEAWMTYIKLAFFDHFWACWLHVRWIPHWMVEVKARDPWLTTFTSFGAMAVKNTLNLRECPKPSQKCLVLLFFLFHFGSWFEICEQERWRMWIRKMPRGTLCISCQLCSVSFGRSRSDCGQEHRRFDQSTVLGEFGALENVLSCIADLQEELLPCVVLFGNGSTAFTNFGDIAWHNLMTRTLA